MKTNKTIYKPFIRQKDYEGGITRNEVNFDDSVTDIWKLSSNENILGASPLAIEAIMNNLTALHEYTFRDDSPIREAIVKSNNRLQFNQVFAANGGSEILEIICRAFVSPDLECIISTPTFYCIQKLYRE